MRDRLLAGSARGGTDAPDALKRTDAPDALKTLPLVAGEEVRAVVGPGEDTGFGGAAYMVFTSLRVLYRVKQGWSGFTTHPLIDLRDLRTLSITPSWKPGSQPHLMPALQVDGHPPFKVIWPRPGEHRDTCLVVDDNGSGWTLSYPILVWWRAVIDAEEARATWRGGVGGYPGMVLQSILLEPGEQALDCLFGWINTSETAGLQVGGLLLTNARLILFTRGTFSRVQPLGDVSSQNDAGVQISDDGAYRFRKSWPLDAVTKLTVAYDGSKPYLAIDDGRMVPVPGDTETREARVRAFVGGLRREREKFGSAGLPAVHPPTCGKCGSPIDSRDLYCSACGAPRSTG